MINEKSMKGLFLTLAIAAVFLFSLAYVLAQESQPVGLGMSVSVQCTRGGQPIDCSQTGVTATTTTAAVTTTTTTLTTTTTTATAATSQTATTSETPTETSSPITSTANQGAGIDFSDPLTQAGIFIIIVVVIVALILFGKGYVRTGSSSNFRYQYSPR